MTVKVFFSYCHKDEALRDQVEVQLALLKRQGVIEAWHDRRIGAGADFAAAIDKHVEEDDIILLLVSADFIASDWCYDIEMKRAMERHEAGQAIVIPVILRACDWHEAPFGRLNATPPDGKPITQFPDRDQALLEVAKAVRAAAARVAPKAGGATAESAVAPIRALGEAGSRPLAGPRSSNLALAKTFTDRDKDLFRHQSFEYLVLFFENSLAELAARNPGVEGDLRRIDADRFTAAVYKHGKAVARCTIFMGDRLLGNGIAYSASEAAAGNGFNEMLSVEADEQSLYLRGLGMGFGGAGRDAKLSQEGAAELYWGMLVGGLQAR